MLLDRHALYERAVQTPEHDVELLEQLFRARRRRAPRSLREDFCGTARVSIAWVGSDDEREAVAIDLDREVLERGRRHARAELEHDERARLRIVRADVRRPSERAFDLVLAPNFSWACFHDASTLGAYLDGARRALEHDGLLVLELFGGPALRRPLRHQHRHGDFTYVWEHRSHDPAREITDARIHFELDDGRRIDDAFRYEYRAWRPRQVETLLRERGFGRVELLVEDARGALVAREREPAADSWNGYLIADARGTARRRHRTAAV
ncbi:MAG: class I SAM-dependent methyltransferase [Myxococcota bacterium]|nr:class I SAM-dependent methyltransferase [Myxococcota bacterium]